MQNKKQLQIGRLCLKHKIDTVDSFTNQAYMIYKRSEGELMYRLMTFDTSQSYHS